MKHTTRWSPDTCGCVLEYDWDDAEPAETRQHTPTRVIRVCRAHGLHLGLDSHFATVTEENTRKNRVLGHIADNFDDLVAKRTDEDGNTVRTVRLSWGFDASRALHVTLPQSLTALRRTAIRTELTTRFGAEGVVVD